MHALLQEILDEVRPLLGQGRVASYIPALADVAPDQLGIAVCSADGELFHAGDAQTPFSIQSISKVFSLVQAIGHRGDRYGSASATNPPGNRSIRSCSWSSNAAGRAIRSSTPARW